MALTAAMLRTVNSPAFGLKRPCETFAQAVAMLGIKPLSALITDLMVRRVLRTDGPQLTRFWDVSGKRSYALARLSRNMGEVAPDVGQSFGLFCDVGIPLMMQRFPDYGKTLKACNDEPDRSFTAIEHEHHQADHALIGGNRGDLWVDHTGHDHVGSALDSLDHRLTHPACCPDHTDSDHRRTLPL